VVKEKRMKKYRKAITLAATVTAAMLLTHLIGNAQNSSEQARVVLSHELPQLDGAHLKASVVEVIYAPGGRSQPHSHPCPVIGYVAEGAIRYQVKGEKEAVYKAGESFYEAANGIHQVSANASDKEPARLVAYFLCDHQTPLSVAVHAKHTGGN
jgi:quercetin dioxygenase-like cupin family protein